MPTWLWIAIVAYLYLSGGAWVHRAATADPVLSTSSELNELWFKWFTVIVWPLVLPIGFVVQMGIEYKKYRSGSRFV